MKTTTLRTITGNQLAHKLQTLIFNHFNVKVGGIPQNMRDTEFDWILTTDQSIDRKTLATIQSFIDGAMAMWRS